MPNTAEPGYVAYTIASVFLIGMAFCFAGVIKYSAITLFRGVRALVSPLFWLWRWYRRRRRRKPEHPQHLCQFRTKNRCTNPRHKFSSIYSAPFCYDHWLLCRARRTQEARAFDNEKYPYAEEMYPKGEASQRSSDESTSARTGKREDGFLYIYVSEFDLERQRVDPDKVERDDKFFYKIGRTTRAPSQRIAEQAGALFLSGRKHGIEGEDYFAAVDCKLAEYRVHKELARTRYLRFDDEDTSFETEWFLVTHEAALETTKKIVAEVNEPNEAAL